MQGELFNVEKAKEVAAKATANLERLQMEERKKIDASKQLQYRLKVHKRYEEQVRSCKVPFVVWLR